MEIIDGGNDSYVEDDFEMSSRRESHTLDFTSNSEADEESRPTISDDTNNRDPKDKAKKGET